jgi:hypothetical protein
VREARNRLNCRNNLPMSFAISFVFAPCTASMSPPIAAVCVNSVGLPQRLRFFRLLERSLETTSWLY